jgi:hypothetical protein
MADKSAGHDKSALTDVRIISLHAKIGGGRDKSGPYG